MLPRSNICLVIGTPRGFTRSVLEALLKRGSRVILACPDPGLGYSEHKRLSGLYGQTQISVSVVEGWNLRSLESLLIRALDTHGGVTDIVNSTADNKLNISRRELRGSVEEVENYLNHKQQQHDVDAIRHISKLAVKYLGKHNGFQGGSLLNLVSGTELFNNNRTKLPNHAAVKLSQQSTVSQLSQLTGSMKLSELNCAHASLENQLSSSVEPQLLNNSRLSDTSRSNQSSFECSSNQSAVERSQSAVNYACGTNCTVLGTTRALGLSKHVLKHGVRTSTVYQPTIDYPELSAAAQITDDQHSPYYTWDRYSAYCREYTGYMALHAADTGRSGTAWRFNSELRLEPVSPAMLPSTCKLTNKMCYWLGCPHVDAQSAEDLEAPPALGGSQHGAHTARRIDSHDQ